MCDCLNDNFYWKIMAFIWAFYIILWMLSFLCFFIKISWQYINDNTLDKYKIDPINNFLINKFPCSKTDEALEINIIINYLGGPVIWPVLLLMYIWFGIIFVLRTIFRTKKTLSNLAKYSHKHENSDIIKQDINTDILQRGKWNA